jgi:hypothetical protein
MGRKNKRAYNYRDVFVCSEVPIPAVAGSGEDTKGISIPRMSKSEGTTRDFGGGPLLKQSKPCGLLMVMINY